MAAADVDLEPGTAAAASGAGGGAEEAPAFGRVLLVWASLTVAIHAGLWLTGFGPSRLAAAVGQGAARAEASVRGEVSDDLIRKVIRTQKETLPFWTVLALLGDFLAEPAALALRAAAVATAFSAAAALFGRPIGYDRALSDCARAQGFWVLGLAVRGGLMAALRRPDAATSAVLLLPPGTYPAALALWLGQLDPFVLMGWGAMAAGGVRRGQVGVPGAVAVCGGLAVFEAVARVVLGLAVGAAMRLSVMPA